MASIRPKSPTVLIPDVGNSEKSFCRLCHVNNIGHLELLHHNISAPHIKKLKAFIRLRSQCMICPVYMSDIKAAEAHVQDPRHERRLKCNFNPKVATNVDTRFRCPPCRLLFTCSIALELHLYMSHKVSFSTENLPDLSDIIFQLSGCSADASKARLSPECVLCEVKCEAMDNFVMHMFSNVHMKSLRTSTCLVCELKFIHVNDREGHLHAWKHKFHLQKVCLSNRIKKWKDLGQGEHTRYVCMYCMIWCKSWPCFVLHLLGSAHKLCAENQDHQHINPAVYAQLQTENIVETIQDVPISTMSGRNCKSWLDQPSGLSAWCLVCEEMIFSPEMLEKHLECHPLGLKSMHMKKINYWRDFLCREGKGCELFECDVCYIFFKNDFSLTTHKAFQQHHIQQAHVLNGGVLCRCYDCRMRSKSTTSLSPKPNSLIFEGCKSDENVTTVENHNVKDFNTEANKESSHGTSGGAKTQEKTNIVTENIIPVSGLGNSNMTIVEQSSDNRKLLANVSQSTEEPMNEAFNLLPNSIQQENNIKSEVNVEKGKMVSQIFYTHDNPEGHYPCAINETSASGNKVEIHTDCQTNEQTLETHVNQKTKEETLQPPCGCEEESTFKEMVPVVVAAALPPCDSIHNGVHSAMKLVKESFSKAAPKIRKSSTELFSSSKRHKENDLYEHECNRLRSILESAVCEGLQSFISHSTLGEYKHGPGGTSVSLCTEDVEGVSVAFATAVVSQSSTTQLDYPLLNRDDRENRYEETYDDADKIHGVRNVVQETDFNVLDEEKLYIDDDTQRLNVVFEEDSSSDSDDRGVCVSSNESESSQY